MLESIKTWIVTVLIGAFIVNIVDMILPSSKIKPYINLVVNFIFVFIILTPIANFFSKDMSLEDKILKYMSEYNKQYVDSVNGLADKTGNNSLSKGYEDGLKDIQSKENEKSKQVFNEKDEPKNTKHSLDLSEDKLKEDLVKILDVSIETIEID